MILLHNVIQDLGVIEDNGLAGVHVLLDVDEPHATVSLPERGDTVKPGEEGGVVEGGRGEVGEGSLVEEVQSLLVVKMIVFAHTDGLNTDDYYVSEEENKQVLREEHGSETSRPFRKLSQTDRLPVGHQGKDIGKLHFQ